MQLHRNYCQRLGIAETDLEATAPAPITHAYTRHLLAVAYSGSIADIVATVLPCQLGYAEIGTALACKGRGGARITPSGLGPTRRKSSPPARQSLADCWTI
jgi:thiaminase/transcriptional activator TenA